MVAEEPAEIDGEIDSESDENPSSSSEEGTLCFLLSVLFCMAIRVVEFLSGGYKIRKIFAYELTYHTIGNH